MNLKQALVFAILIENNNGVIDKAPSYILEKLRACELSDNPEHLLDMRNQKKLEAWMQRWHISNWKDTDE